MVHKVALSALTPPLTLPLKVTVVVGMLEAEQPIVQYLRAKFGKVFCDMTTAIFKLHGQDDRGEVVDESLNSKMGVVLILPLLFTHKAMRQCDIGTLFFKNLHAVLPRTFLTVEGATLVVGREAKLLHPSPRPAPFRHPPHPPTPPNIAVVDQEDVGPPPRLLLQQAQAGPQAPRHPQRRGPAPVCT